MFRQKALSALERNFLFSFTFISLLTWILETLSVKKHLHVCRFLCDHVLGKISIYFLSFQSRWLELQNTHYCLDSNFKNCMLLQLIQNPKRNLQTSAQYFNFQYLSYLT